MSIQHQSLAGGRWAELSLLEQMAHVGSEVERALSWKKKNNDEYTIKAFERALELIDLCITYCRMKSHLKEMTRTRELLADYFIGSNQYAQTEQSLKAYFFPFAYAVSKNK